MSGRALYRHMNLFYRLAKDLDGDLVVSYSAGRMPLTWLTFWLRALDRSLLPLTCSSLRVFETPPVLGESGGRDAPARRANLDDLARDKMRSLELALPRLSRIRAIRSIPCPRAAQVGSGLGAFDCITAPCIERCPIHQDVPTYASCIVEGKHRMAMETILASNPLPGVTGYVCTCLCQTRCTRNNYDEAVAIRALKR